MLGPRSFNVNISARWYKKKAFAMASSSNVKEVHLVSYFPTQVNLASHATIVLTANETLYHLIPMLHTIPKPGTGELLGNYIYLQCKT